MPRHQQRGLGTSLGISICLMCSCLIAGSFGQDVTTPAPSCDDPPSPETVDAMASLIMYKNASDTTQGGMNRTFAFYMCEAPGFVFTFPVDTPLVNQFALWCEERNPGVWLPKDFEVPKCQPEAVKAATSPGAKQDYNLATLYLYQMATRGTVPFLDIDRTNNVFNPVGVTTVTAAFGILEKTFSTSNPEKLAAGINALQDNIFSKSYSFQDMLGIAVTGMESQSTDAQNAAPLYGQSKTSNTKKITGTIGALIGAGVFVAVFMACTIMSRIRDGMRH